MTKQLFVVNKTDTNLQFKRGYFYVSRNGFKPIEEAEKDHPDFVYALDRKWIEITDEAPADAPAVDGVKATEVVEPYRGMTSDELKEELTKEVPKTTTSEPIGKPVESEAPPADPVVDTSVEVTEPVVETKTEAAPKRGRKAAADKAGE